MNTTCSLAGTPTQIKLEELKTKRTQETRAPLNEYDNTVTAFFTTQQADLYVYGCA
jgi:hypothetical protein